MPIRTTQLIRALLLMLTVVAISGPASARIRYVNGAATGLNNGTSWVNAYNKFDSVVLYIRDTTIQDTFWVAQGTYKPTGITGFRTGNTGLKIYGGFNGTETSLAQRNWTAYQTILDGDIGSPSVNTDNCWAVLEIDAAVASIYCPRHPSMRIDGFKIINAYEPNISSANYYAGGAIRYFHSGIDSIEIANCVFSRNTSIWGGAFMYTNVGANALPGCYSVARITNCRFEDNTAWRHGGAITTQHVTPVLLSSPEILKLTITDCLFSNNTAAFGGAIANLDSAVALDITRCTIRGNAASVAGGALYDSSVSKTRVYNTLIMGNSAANSCVYHCNPAPTGTIARPHKLFQCTIAGNKSSSSSFSDYALTLNGRDSISNCIFWDNSTGSGKQIAIPSGVHYIHNNIFQGGAPGTTAAFTVNPLFVSPGFSTAAPFPASGSYDYHLSVTSPAIDVGLTTIGAPAGMNATDLDNSNRVFGPAPDLGAYERTYCTLPAVYINPAPAYICLSSQDSILLTASGGGGAGTYTWINTGSTGSTLWAKDSGMYYVMSYDTVTHCRSQGSAYVKVVPKLTPVITRTANTLSVPAVYSSYKWYKGGVLISGATAASYTPSSNGLYKIQVTLRGAECMDSAFYNLTNLGITALPATSSRLRVYPNPAKDAVFLEGSDIRSVFVFDLQGRRLLSANNYDPQKGLDVHVLSAGVYMLSVDSKEGNSRLKFVKEKE